MKKRERNLWPYGILAVILLGVVLIIISVRISLKHSVTDDTPFFMQYKQADEEINDILLNTKNLQSHFNFYIQANTIPTKDNILKPYSPYFRPPHRDRIEANSSNILFTKTLNTIYLLVEPIDGDINDMKITAFIQKLGDTKKQEIFIFNPNDNSFVASKPQKNSMQIPIGELQTNTELKEANVFMSPSFEFELKGRWIVSLLINYQDKTIVLEKEFSSMDKSQSQPDYQ